jgi:sterol desaturase/sphingolipid hydroxylase (fatty acid hydroxylase superfamily)
MEFYESLFYATPLFTSLILIEIVWGNMRGKNVYHNIPDALSSLSSGMANIIVRTLGVYITIIGYSYFLNKVAIYEISSHSPLAWIITFIALDFAGYWKHRWAHEINVLWQTHLVHHSSEEYNLAVALRQPTTDFFNYGGFLLIPAAIVGIPVEMIAVGSFIHLYMQYWYHTQLINKMGFLESFLVTPSHHRVHHAQNPEYIDKNYGQIFIIWDKLFGTFQQEMDDLPPVYGITSPVRTWNPFKIDVMHWWQLLKDSAMTTSLKDKLLIFVKPTGWRPKDMVKKRPMYKVTDPFNFEKYRSNISTFGIIWAFIEVAVVSYPLTMVLFWMMGNGATRIEQFIYSIFLLVSIYVYTTTMEGKSTKMLNFIRVLFACGIMFVSINNGFIYNLLDSPISYVVLLFYISAFIKSIFTKPTVAAT